MRVAPAICCVIALNCVAESAPQQTQTPPVQTPGTGPATSEKEKSLDELLGIGESGGKRASEESDREQKKNLDRILTEKESQNTMEATVTGMRRSAELLRERESGMAVQRIQEDVLARLDALIQSAQSQQQQSSSSSSSSSSGESKGSPKPEGGSKGSKGKSQPDSSEEQRREQARNRAEQRGEKEGSAQSQPTGDRAGELPPVADAVEGGVIEETDEEWGSLPARTRESLRQGVREKMSSVYRRWTEAYYRRIAEEARP